MKRNKGITLIALVITIIVLLILAGVAISMLSGENGILRKAAEAKNKTEESQKKEETTLIDYEIDSHFILNNSNFKCRGGYITGVTIPRGENTPTDTVNSLNEALKGTGYFVAIYPDSENGKYVEKYVTDTTMKLTTGMGIKKEGEKDGKIVARVIVFGNVNSDNIIKNGDASLINQLRAGMIKKEENWIFLPAFDVNHDGKIDREDVSCTSRFTYGSDNENYYEIDQNQYATDPNQLEIVYLADVEKNYLNNVFATDSKYKFEYDESRKSYVLKGAEDGELSTNITSLISGSKIYDENDEKTDKIKEGCYIRLDIEDGERRDYDIIL